MTRFSDPGVVERDLGLYSRPWILDLEHGKPNEPSSQ